MTSFSVDSQKRVRRRGKEFRERLLATIVLIPALPVFVVCAAAIKIEGLFNSEARGPIFFVEQRVSRGRVFGLLKFRTLTRSALTDVGNGPTHIAVLEKQGRVTRAGRAIRQWYLDELPQLINIARGDMFLIGTRPWPLELYEAELAEGITRKRDMPAGLVGPVQAHKGDPSHPDGRTLDAEYWAAFQTYPGWKLLMVDFGILWRSAKVQLQHKGI